MLILNVQGGLKLSLRLLQLGDVQLIPCITLPIMSLYVLGFIQSQEWVDLFCLLKILSLGELLTRLTVINGSYSTQLLHRIIYAVRVASRVCHYRLGLLF